jgi:hypothetical protein
MEVKYYICTRPQAEGYYFIHREDCPLLPAPGKRIYLGTFLSPVEAAEEGKKYFSRIRYCLFCSEEHNDKITQSVLFEVQHDIKNITSVQVIAGWESALFCYVN